MLTFSLYFSLIYTVNKQKHRKHIMELTLKQQLQEKQEQGFETVWIHVEDSVQYETGTINIDKALALFEDEDTHYTVDGMWETHLFASGDELYANAAMLNVYLDEEECIVACTNYLWELHEADEDIITLSEARKKVLDNSGKL